MSSKKPHAEVCDELTLVIITNQKELDTLCSWCDKKGILPPYLGSRDSYPIACSVEDGTWTHRMNKSAKYIAFDEFLKSIE
jgi:hypothetical protein